jgi:Type IIA topoisomerase (DNA gyrase/topo II, topoisomerase IV), A subunit
VIKTLPVHEDDEFMVITQQGQVARLKVSDVRQTKRLAQGVKVIALAEGDRVVDACLVELSAEEPVTE